MRFELTIDYPEEHITMNLRRMEAYRRFTYVDRVPVGYCLVARYFARALGIPYKDFFRDAETHYYWQLQFAKFRIEQIPEDMFCTAPVIVVYPYFDNALDSDALGAEVVWPDNETLQACPTIHSVEAMERFKIPPPDSGLWGRLVDWCEQMRTFATQTRVTFRDVEGRVEVSPPSTGGLSPHMLAIDLVGPDFYWWQIEYPEACHRFLDKITRAIIQTQEHFNRIWPRPRPTELWLAEDSAQVMSIDMFREFCIPYDIRLCERLTGPNGGCIIHMCGQSEHLHPALLEDLRVTEFSIFGYAVPPAVAARNLGGRMRLWGNLNPMLLLNGSRAEVREAALECIGALAPCGGFLLGDGANVCPGTPLENLRAVTEAAEEYGLPVVREKIQAQAQPTT